MTDWLGSSIDDTQDKAMLEIKGMYFPEQMVTLLKHEPMVPAPPRNVFRTLSGILVTYLNYRPSSLETMEFEIAEGFIVFSFHLSGSGYGAISTKSTTEIEIPVSSKTTVVSHHPNSRCRIELEADQSYKVLNIYVPLKVLKRLTVSLGTESSKIEKIGRNHFNRSTPFTPQIRTILDQMRHCRYQNLSRSVFLESKVLELIAIQLWQLEDCTFAGDEHKRLYPGTIKKLESARTILLQRFESPPTITKLAKEIGLSSSSLKRGFKTRFGLTVFDYLRQVRLNRSIKLLKDGEQNITEIAYSLGYYDTSHFIREFSGFFGTSPGAFAKQLEA